MKKIQTLLFLILFGTLATAQTKITWVTTTQKAQWQTQENIVPTDREAQNLPVGLKPNVEIQVNKTLQDIHGFGMCHRCCCCSK